MRKIIRSVDLETGKEQDSFGPGIVEYGHHDVISTQEDMLGQPYGWEVSPVGVAQIINQGAPIGAQYEAVHHIHDEDMLNMPAWHEFSDNVSVAPEGYEIVAYAAYGKKTEAALIDPIVTKGLDWICLYKVALRLWPESPAHSNGAVSYFIRPEGLDRSLAGPAHRARPDAYVTAFTLREALKVASVEDLIKWSDEPAFMPRCKIGDKYRTADGRGTPWSEVETSFLEWILKKDFDEDTRHTVTIVLANRREEERRARERADLDRQFVAQGFAPSAKSSPGQFAPESDNTNQEQLL